ncbi:UNVERIFIED_CONTAM: hypothetical protein PYX00_010124 [Menopon gallinae]|uniref:Uncharacterized protein n=1 Tax=Menopon gallinae TaxID=328185 RepID=A0AAW2HEC7_9NEOP
MSLRRKLRKQNLIYKERGKDESKMENVVKEEKMETDENFKLNSTTEVSTNCDTPGEQCKENGENEGANSNENSDQLTNDETKTELPLVVDIKVETASDDGDNSQGNPNPETGTPVEDSGLNYNGANEAPERIQLSHGNDTPDYLVDHNYFKHRRIGFVSLTDLIELQKRSDSNLKCESTLRFENRFETDENRMQQQTIEQRDSVTKHADPNSLLKVNHSNIKIFSACSVSGRNWSGSESSSISPDSKRSVSRRVDDLKVEQKLNSIRYPLRRTCRLRRLSSNGSDRDDDINWGGSPLMTQAPVVPENSSDADASDILKNKEIDKSLSDFKLNSLDDIAKQLSEMEKIIQSKCEYLCDSDKDSNVKNSDVMPPKLRKIASKDDAPESRKEGECVLPMPKLTKMMPEDKNWNLEYTGDDVKNLALDDLLLRASELNAENFTKALGQNTARNGSKGDGSDFVVAFPNSRTDDSAGKESELSKERKKTKLDFLKKYVKEDKAGKTIEEEPPKKDVSPKKPGIKVKTVQNINEEFKDSLGARLKMDGILSSESPKPLFTVSDDIPKMNGLPDHISSNPNTFANCRSGKIGKDGRTVGEEAKEARPFIMTIIQNKDGTGSDHVTPTLTSPKRFARSRSINENSFLGEEHTSENKKAEDGVTLVVSEPRPRFEMVDDYDGKGILQKNFGVNSHYVVHYRNGTVAKKSDDGNILKQTTVENGSSVACKKKNIPFHINTPKKYLRVPASNGEKILVTTLDESGKRLPRPPNRLIKCATDATAEKPLPGEKQSFVMTSVEQRITAKETSGKFIRLCPAEVVPVDELQKPEEQSNFAGEDSESDRARSKKQMISLATFANILRDILPDKWVLSLDKRYGLQIIKTHLDELLNPSIMISVVVGRSGKVTVNVRGRQLEKSHELFSNLCDVGNSNEKISINYILAIINKLRFFNVCFGCDDLSLKKYWCEDGFIEYYTEFQQTYRSHICESLVRLGKKRCYPCYRMHESLKKRKRREQLMKKTDAEPSEKTDSAGKKREETPVCNAAPANHPGKGVKRNLEEFLEESFINMKQKITDEIEKTKEDDESEKVPKTQDEVLSFMGLTRKDSLDINLRKSKRERKGFKKCESEISNNVNKEELYFLEKYWQDINVLFSTSLLIGAYSRTSTGRLREKCRMFHKLLSTWRGIGRDNPDWVGGYINLAENLVDDDDLVNVDSAKEKFDKMDVPALRAYIINCVKEVNKIKSKLRTKNNYFKVLYNTFVKPKMKKARHSSPSQSPEGKVDPAPAKDAGKERTAAEKPEEASRPAQPEQESSDEKDEDVQSTVVSISDGD